jgi:hypothetical protein
MDSKGTDNIPYSSTKLEYYEGWLDLRGEAKTRSGVLQYDEFQNWLDLKVMALESGDMFVLTYNLSRENSRLRIMTGVELHLGYCTSGSASWLLHDSLSQNP